MNPKLTPFEKAIFEQLLQQMPADHAEILRSQLAEVNRVDRLVGDIQIEFHKMKFFKVDLNRLRRFGFKSEETEFPFTIEIDNQSIAAKMVVMRHKLFNFEFSDEVKAYRKRTDFKVTLGPYPSLE